MERLLFDGKGAFRAALRQDFGKPGFDASGNTEAMPIGNSNLRLDAFSPNVGKDIETSPSLFS